MSGLQESGIVCAPATATAVANEFLNLAQQESANSPTVDQMKLQKLLFYAHAWHLALKDQPLFEEDFEAWPWGPVVRSVYIQTREYGRGPVEAKLTEISRTSEDVLDFNFTTPNGVSDAETKAFIKQIWDTHKAYTGIQLSNSTHAPGEPWTIIKERYGSLEDKPTIPNELIAFVFKKKLSNDSTSGN